jgi:WD40 repeat protein
MGTWPKCQVSNARTGNRIYGFYRHADKVSAIQFFTDGALLASASVDETIRLWDLNAPESPFNDISIICLGLSQLGSIFATDDVEIRLI